MQGVFWGWHFENVTLLWFVKCFDSLIIIVLNCNELSNYVLRFVTCFRECKDSSYHIVSGIFDDITLSLCDMVLLYDAHRSMPYTKCNGFDKVAPTAGAWSSTNSQQPHFCLLWRKCFIPLIHYCTVQESVVKWHPYIRVRLKFKTSLLDQSQLDLLNSLLEDFRGRARNKLLRLGGLESDSVWKEAWLRHWCYVTW